MQAENPNIPIWLANMEDSLGGLDRLPPGAGRYAEEFYLLHQWIPNCERWIDENRIAGDPANQLIVRRILAHFDGPVVWSLLEPGKGPVIDGLRHISIRLKGLLPKVAA